jgi:hypothetical protein
MHPVKPFIVDYDGQRFNARADMRLIHEAEDLMGTSALSAVLSGTLTIGMMLVCATAALRIVGKNAITERMQREMATATNHDPGPFEHLATLTLREFEESMPADTDVSEMFRSFVSAFTPDIPPNQGESGNATAEEPGRGTDSSESVTVSSASNRKSSGKPRGRTSGSN